MLSKHDVAHFNMVLVAVQLIATLGGLGGAQASNSPSSSLTKRADCFDPSPVISQTDRMNVALNSSGPGFILSLCPKTNYTLVAPINFAFPNQEISTQGYPSGDDRAFLIVNGPVFNGTGHTTAITGTCANCDGTQIRNVQIDGTRRGGTKLNGGANIEMGGDNQGQVIDHVRSLDSRSWSCLHVVDGRQNCQNVTISNCDIGPCGLDSFNDWADGISFDCRDGVIINNMVQDPTDGGIVIFGSPGTHVRNNTIWVEKSTSLGGINLVDFQPFNGNYAGVVVENNTIMGGFAQGQASGGETKGDSQFDVIIKMGIAIGPRTWFGNKYLNNVSNSAIVQNNQFTGAFGYGIAMTSARNFTVVGNVLIGNTSFIGSRGPNCSSVDQTPTPAPFVMQQSTVSDSTTQTDFQNISDGDTLTCVMPPAGGDFWPFGGNPSTANRNVPSKNRSKGKVAGLVVGIIGAIVVVAILAWFIRKKALERLENQKTAASDSAAYQRKYIRDQNEVFSKI